MRLAITLLVMAMAAVAWVARAQEPPIDFADAQPGGVAKVQVALRDFGFDPGKIDGVWGPDTAGALARFCDARASACADRETLASALETGHVQAILKRNALYGGDIDGDWGR